MSVGVIEVKDNKSTVRKLSKAERRTLIVLDNFCEANITEDANSPQVVEVENTEDFIKKFGEENAAGKKVLKRNVQYEDGQKEAFEIEKMADFDIRKLSGQSKIIGHLEISKNIMNDLKRLKTKGVIDLLGNSEKVDELINALRDVKEKLNQLTSK